MPPWRPRFDSIPAGASFEDDVQLDELRIQLPDADAADQLDAAATEILCLQLGIPAEDFGLGS
jgi:hypothetical protein